MYNRGDNVHRVLLFVGFTDVFFGRNTPFYPLGDSFQVFISKLSEVLLDKEDKIISQLARDFSEKVFVERLHASEIEDVHSLIIDGEFSFVF